MNLIHICPASLKDTKSTTHHDCNGIVWGRHAAPQLSLPHALVPLQHGNNQEA